MGVRQRLWPGLYKSANRPSTEDRGSRIDFKDLGPRMEDRWRPGQSSILDLQSSILDPRDRDTGGEMEEILYAQDHCAKKPRTKNQETKGGSWNLVLGSWNVPGTSSAVSSRA